MPQTLARHVTEIGRIRIGHQVPIKGGKNAGKPRPERLTHFRLTSNSQTALLFASRKYGGEVRAWTIPQAWKGIVREPEDKWELFTTTETLDILMRPDSLMSTLFERWEGGYCALRCNGEVILKDARGERTGMDCQCPSIPEERKALAAQGKACQEVSRIMVMLEGLPLGQWRLDTRGFYAPAEIRGMQDLLRACEVDQMILKALMRLEQRTDRQLVKGEPVTRNYNCVVIEPRQAIEQLVLAGERRRVFLGPRPDESQKSLVQHVGDLYGDDAARHLPSPERPAGEGGLPYIAQIEAAILANHGQIEPWFAWAERTFQKQRTAFSVADYERFLRAILAAASRTSGSEGKTQSPVDNATAPDEEESISAFDLSDEDGEREHAMAADDPMRNTLAHLAANTRDFLDGSQSPQLAAQTEEACKRGFHLAENPDATRELGEACIGELRKLGAQLSGQMGLTI